MSSVKSTTSSCNTHPENKTLEDILDNDRIRYKRKGYGLIFAIWLWLVFFFVLPEIGKDLYGSVLAAGVSQGVIFWAGITIVHQGIYVVANLVMHLIYWLDNPFFERYKTQSNPWPWKADPKAWQETQSKLWKTIVLNAVIIGQLAVILKVYFDQMGVNFDINDWPTSIELGVQITFFMLVEDTTFFWSHKLLHHPAIYRHIHKQHHEYKTTIGIASEYCHPFEYVFSNIIPTALGPQILGMRCHFFTLLMWFALRTGETIDGHCGYDFSWSPYRLLPFSGGAQYHDYHHSHNVGNYSSFFTFWDTICGSNRHYFQFLAKKQEQEAMEAVKKQLDSEYVKKNN